MKKKRNNSHTDTTRRGVAEIDRERRDYKRVFYRETPLSGEEWG